MGFSGGSNGKESACNVGNLGLIAGLGRSLGEGHGNPLQYSCLENPHGHRSLAGYNPQGHKESDATLNTHFFKILYDIQIKKIRHAKGSEITFLIDSRILFTT